MKFNLLGKVASLALGTAMLTCPSSLQAGWGSLHGGGSAGFGSGGSSGSYTGSSGGGSSGYAALYSSYGGGSSGGSSGSSASYASSGGDSSGGTRRPGLFQRLHAHHAAKLARRAASGGSSGYGSSGYGSSGYSASYASSGGGSSGGGSSGGYGSSYGSSGGSSGGASTNYGSVGYSSGVSYGSTGSSSGYGSGGGAYYGASNVKAGAATGSLVSNVESNSLDDAVYLTVAVPSGTKVFVNNNETNSTGVVRKFVSRGLQAGKRYRFQVRAEMADADGKLMTEEKSLVVSAGEEQQVQFAFAEHDSRVETAITLTLPEGANVTLAGNATKATGESRTFRTSRLKSGEYWDDYDIEVEYQGEVKHQSIRLVGGDKLQLTFDFDSPASTLAAR